MAKKKKVNYDVISVEQLRKIERAARRQIDLERGVYIKGGPHGGTKRDAEEDWSGSLSPAEIQRLLEEERELEEELE